MIGRLALFLFRLVQGLPYIFKKSGLLLREIYNLGLLSLPIVAFTAIFLGLVVALQTSYQMERWLPAYYIGATAVRTIMIELAPVAISLVVAGRIGSFIAAEIGTMKVTEQLDALKTLAVDPIKYVCLPKVIAGGIILPVLVVIAEGISILSAGLAAKGLLDVDFSAFTYGVRRFFYFRDLFGGLLKTVFFGLAITLSGTYFGMETGVGAEGVGRSTTLAVVMASAFVLIFNFFVAFLVLR